MIYYLTWQEDDWLDEIIDRFPGVNALVPNGKSLQAIRQAKAAGEVTRMVIVVNVGQEPEETKQFLDVLAADGDLASYPLFLVGGTPDAKSEWQAGYPQADVVAIDCHPFEFDYDAVLSRMERRMEEQR
ncbi:hypothetical protein ACTID9_20725 [Brevibacillus fluminis]|uniref:hypothetical protein n=1 Tax=Brevibacillus fluminis TaxID=511487 RepID=UPI003F8A477B